MRYRKNNIYIIAHNKLTMNTGFNLEKLKLELKEIEINEKYLSLTCFEIEELKAEILKIKNKLPIKNII